MLNKRSSSNGGSLVSVIITTKNEEDVIERSIKSVIDQNYGKIELILVDNHSTDNTVKKASRYIPNIFDFGPERSAQRNFGARKAKGKYLLFLDADMELTPNVIKECVDLSGRAKNFGGIIIPEESKYSNFLEHVKAYERSFYNDDGDQVTDAARFFSNEIFNKLHGYDEKLTGPEDWDLSDKVKMRGYVIGRTRSLIYHYERIGSIYSLLRKKFYYGLKSGKYLNKNKIRLVSPKTIYFLRPVFYKKWKKVVAHPLLSFSMFIMFFLETIAGGLGFIVGKVRNI